MQNARIEGRWRAATRRRACSLMLAGAIVTVLPLAATEIDEATYREQIERWRRDREASLTAEDGWLTLVGLHWLVPGEQRIGTGAGNEVRLPAGAAPEDVGVLVVTDGGVRLEALPSANVRVDGRAVERVELRDDRDGEPTVIEIGDLRCYVIARAGKFALRVKDPTSFARRNFSGIETFATSSDWRFEARFEPYDPPRKLPVPTAVADTLQEMMSPGAVVFEVDGRSFRIDAQADSAEAPLFLIFGDQTNGRTTYGGGRYLYTDPPSADGRVVVDFNKGYNPPCAYTPFATCPLPPSQNRLAVPIEAGERFRAKPTR